MLKLTKEQERNLQDWKEGQSHFSISARAGSGKTFQIRLNVSAFPETSHLILYFNKRNAEEARATGLNGQTAHSFGFSLLKENIEKKAKVDYRKWYSVVGEPGKGEKLKETVALISHLYETHVGKIEDQEDINQVATNLGVPELPIERVKKAFRKAVQLALQGSVSFSDMLVLPVLYQWTPFASPEHLYLDEAQDLSPAKQALVKLINAPRTCIVGDPHQAIYGFAGADENAFDNLLASYPGPAGRLTVCFRCARAIVEEARAYVPDLTAWENAEEGSVVRDHALSLADLTPDTAVLCRNNRPLFSLAIHALSLGIPVTIRGKDFCEAVLSLVAKAEGRTKEEKIIWLEREEEREKVQRKDFLHPIIEDRFSCARLIVQNEVEDKLLNFFSDDEEPAGRPVLSTIHKAKGLEWDNVFLYLPSLIGNDGQEVNLKYVAITRARRNLFYVPEGL